MPELSETLSLRLDALRPFVERTATLDFSGDYIFSSCLRSSLTRTFEFVDLVTKGNPDHAFFLVPALRGITEDIIYFAFLEKFPHEVRERVISHMMQLEVHQRINDQVHFFRTFRPFQPVFSAEIIDIATMKRELRTFWRENGWPQLKRDTPPTREIAQQTVPGILEQVYDFIFRLTSSTVHFNPEQLLRLGWGSIGPEEDVVLNSRFSSRHMGHYHQAKCLVYGCYLLCLYFELFEERLQANQTDLEAVQQLRKHIWREFRWPEMVTFEEMNQAVPDPEATKWPNPLIYGLYSSIMEGGFISGAQQILATQDVHSEMSNGEVPQT